MQRTGLSVGTRVASDVDALWSTIAAADRPANLTEYLERSAGAYGDRIVLDCFDSGRTLTYAALSHEAGVAAGVLDDWLEQQRVKAARG